MKRSSDSISSDPSAKIGNRRARRGVSVIAAAAVLSLAACSAHAQPKSAGAETSSTTTTSPEQGQETLIAKVRSSAEHMAEGVLSRYLTDDKVKKFTTINDDGSEIVSLTYDTSTPAVGFKGGQYSFVVTMGQTRGNGPKPVSEVSFSEEIYSTGTDGELNMWPVASFSLKKHPNSDNWLWTRSPNSKYGLGEQFISDTATPTGKEDQSSPFDIGEFENWVTDFEGRFDWAEQERPIYPNSTRWIA